MPPKIFLNLKHISLKWHILTSCPVFDRDHPSPCIVCTEYKWRNILNNLKLSSLFLSLYIKFDCSYLYVYLVYFVYFCWFRQWPTEASAQTNAEPATSQDAYENKRGLNASAHTQRRRTASSNATARSCVRGPGFFFSEVVGAYQNGIIRSRDGMN